VADLGLVRSHPRTVSVRYFKASYLDASAVVKLVLAEAGSDHINAYFSDRGGFFITSFCLVEALGVLKRKMLKNEISSDQYFAKCFLLLSYLRMKRINIDAPEMSSHETFRRAEDFARRHGLDLSDAVQLVGLKYGRFCHFVQESKPVLITADRALATAAETEGLRVWNCEETVEPPVQ
jgi:predicted nucleic acid-binding protein